MSDVLDRLRAFIEQSTEDPAWYHMRLGRLAAKVMPRVADLFERATIAHGSSNIVDWGRLGVALDDFRVAAERALDEEGQR